VHQRHAHHQACPEHAEGLVLEELGRFGPVGADAADVGGQVNHVQYGMRNAEACASAKSWRMASMSRRS
jgi:hypothetical protein